MSRKRLTPTPVVEKPTLVEAPIVIVGTGNMGGAIAKGLGQAGFASRLVLIDPAIHTHDFQELVGHGARLQQKPDNIAAEKPAALVLAIKPQLMVQVAPLYRECASNALTISIAAGTSIASLQSWLGSSAALVRAMPNLPATIGKGISAACATPATSASQRQFAETLLRAVGDFVWLPEEELLDAVTAVSGSGPAYVFHLVEALSSAAQAVGIPLAVADLLARRTIEGAGALLEHSPDTPTNLRESVTSPAGTTEAALRILMTDQRLEILMIEAVEAATRRARELSKS